jgi:large subunit ribosomal protein L1
MAGRSRRYQNARQVAPAAQAYALPDAIELLKSMESARFDETVEVVVELGIDPRHSDQQVRGSISLPHGTGQSRRVAVFAEGADADAAREAGADIVGSDDLAAQVENGQMDFDVALAVPSMMSKIGRLGRFLGPRGLMPSPKSGTLRPDIAEAVREFKAGKIEFRNDSGGNVHLPVGKRSFSSEALVENIAAVVERLVRMRPAAAKGKYIEKVVVCSTMSPGIRVDMGA